MLFAHLLHLTMKRKKLELLITAVIYIMTALMSTSIAILILRNYSKLTQEFMAGNIVQLAILPAVVAELLAMSLALYDGKYAFERAPIWSYIWKAVKGTLFFAGVWATILLIQKNNITESRYFFVGTLCLHLVLLAVLLYIGQQLIIANFYKTNAATIVGIVTTRARAATISDQLKNDWSRRIAGIMLIDDKKNREHSAAEIENEDISEAEKNAKAEGSVQEEIDHVPVVADAKTLVEWVRANAIDEIFIVVPNNEAPLIVEAVENFIQMGIAVHLNMPSIERLEKRLTRKTKKYVPKTTSRLAYLNKTPMIIFEQPTAKLRYAAAKRVMDILGGIIGSIVTIILFVVLGIIIKLDSPGPIIFSQERVGKNGRKFKMYKFRSMYQDAEARKAELMKQNEMSGLMFKMKDDPRITKVGKFIRKTSLDEFPQFFNVLLGDMSLVGTRPPTVNEFKEYSNYHKRRLAMKPGITGMWQVSGRSDIKDFEDVVKLDCEYIDNWSLKLDVKILFKTLVIVITKKGSE